MKRTNVFRIAVVLCLIGAMASIAALEGLAQGTPPEGDRESTQVNLFGGNTFTGGYLKYSYKVSREGVDTYSITTTEIIPEGDGMYRIENSSTDIVPQDAVSIAFYGISLRGLGFRIPDTQGGTVDLSPLEAVDNEILEPGREYILPDGGFLVVGEESVIGGLDVIYATYTHADFSNVRINLAMPVDLAIRNLLPIFPYLELEYETDTLPEEGAADDFTRMRSFSQIELIEFIYEQ